MAAAESEWRKLTEIIDADRSARVGIIRDVDVAAVLLVR